MDNHAKQIDDQTIEFVRILPGPIEKIWAYLWESDKRGQWFSSGPMPTRPGESFELHFKHSNLSPQQATPPEKFVEMDKIGHVSRNMLLAYEPPHRLVFSFGPDPKESSEVEFRLSQEGDAKDNKVRLTLTHRKITDRNTARSVSNGWHSHLAVLQYRAEGKTPPAFWDVWRETADFYDKRYA